MIFIDFDGWAARRGAQWGILSRFCIYYSKVVYIGVKLVLHFSKFSLRKYSLPIILFRSADGPGLFHSPPLVCSQRKETVIDTGWN